jgi:hypothetical protein
MTAIAWACFAVIVVALLWCEFSAEKITKDERSVLAEKLRLFADEMEYSEITITPGHIRDFAKDLEGDL